MINNVQTYFWEDSEASYRKDEKNIGNLFMAEVFFDITKQKNR